MQSGSERSGRGWYLLLLIPFVATLWVPFYAAADPVLWGIPYFYWYQFLWVPISAILTVIVYLATRDADDPGRADPPPALVGDEERA